MDKTKEFKEAMIDPFQNIREYRSLMSPLSKLNAIEMHEAGRGNSEANIHHGL